ncbi:MAG: outer membrane protein assembly factor BamD [Bacteroidales bacterium]|nr:outer membrane protein assembly factor BamD [Bacteroidales bacterium]
MKKVLFIIAIIACVGCQSEYQKLLKSDDYEAVYNGAMKYYEAKDYYKSYELFEKALPAFRLTEKGETITLLLAKSYYEEQDNLMAAYYFERLVMTYPTSTQLDYAYFYIAKCYYNISPVVTLDQTYTEKAIQSFQNYINKFPQGAYIKESNECIGELRAKLEEKAYNNSKIFFNLEDYKAAVTALKNCLKQYPDSKYREELLYLTLRSSFLLAENSVESKKEDRYDMAIDDYHAYIDEYPNGQWAKDAEKIFLQIKKRTH